MFAAAADKSPALALESSGSILVKDCKPRFSRDILLREAAPERTYEL